jgi:hypothetical protein
MFMAIVPTIMAASGLGETAPRLWGHRRGFDFDQV